MFNLFTDFIKRVVLLRKYCAIHENCGEAKRENTVSAVLFACKAFSLCNTMKLCSYFIILYLQLLILVSSQSEDIRLEPELYDPCKSDISRLCPNVAFGNAQVRNFRKHLKYEDRPKHASYLSSCPSFCLIFFSPLPLSLPLPSDLPPSSPPQMIECLKEQKKQLSQRCHQRIFRLQEVEMTDPELDYQLMRVCKQMIKVRTRRKREREKDL